MWFSDRPDTNRPVLSQKQARSLKFWSYVEEELYYPSSENKGADQLRLCRMLVFPCGGSNNDPIAKLALNILCISLIWIQGFRESARLV